VYNTHRQPHDQEGGMQDVPYDLPHLKLPRLSGLPLRLMVAGLANPITRPLLLPTFLKNGGVTEFRRSRLAHSPTFFPLGPHPEVPEEDVSSEAEVPPFPGPPEEGHRPLRIRDIHEAYRKKIVSPEEMGRRVIRAIESATDQGLHWWIAVDPDLILEQARASARRWEKGHPLGWLDGVPVAIKDEMDVAPFPTTMGTVFLGERPVHRDAPVVARLRAAGALILGKTHMHEIGIEPSGYNQHHGQARNPYHPEYDTGGSSSGSAAVVAAGQAPLALGADGGGSIRIPAAFCGVVGLKPTFGRVSTAGGFTLAWTVGHFGPIGATVEDVAIGYMIMAGRDPQDPTTLDQPPPTLARTHRDSLAGLRVGIDPLWNQDTDPSYAPVLQHVHTLLTEAGAEIIPLRIPHLNRARVAHVISILSEMAASLEPYRDRHRELGWGTRVLLELGRAFTSRDYLLAARVRTEAMKHLYEHFQKVDVILTPASAVPAPPLPSNLITGESDPSLITEIMRFAFLANLTGVPALVLPAGYTENGLPLGIQLMGRWWEEDRLLQIGRVLEARLPRHAPRLYWNLLSG
jgi:Asp-tRNA(Asn)/Glu-tRNA(Gln) amidotransferase A subunit family amidase